MIKFLIFALIFFLICFPSSFLLSIKVFSISLISVLILLGYIKGSISVKIKTILVFILSLCFLMFLLWYSVFLGNYDDNDVYVQIRNLFILLYLIFVFSVVFDNKIISYKEFFSYLFYSSCFYVFAKFLLFIIVTFGFVESDTILLPIKEMIPGVVYSKFFYSSWMFRFATSSDIVVTLLFCCVLIDYKKFHNIYGDKLLLILPVMFIVIIQTYTRALWLMVFITIISQMTIRGGFTILFSLFVFCIVISMYLPSEIYEGIVDVVSARFLDTGSLDAKSYQTKMLFNEFLNYPILGKGSGSYVDSYLRSYEQKFQYENQIVAFLMQFGLLGFLVFLIAISFVCFRLLQGKAKIMHYFLFFIFISSGFTNPNLIIVVSSLVYSLFIFYDSRSYLRVEN